MSCFSLVSRCAGESQQEYAERRERAKREVPKEFEERPLLFGTGYYNAAGTLVKYIRQK